MTRPLLVLRPQPGAEATAARAKALGLEPVVAPLFRIVARDWELPKEQFDALLVTSANAARLLDERFDRTLPVYAVGAATETVLRANGFQSVISGREGVAAIVRNAASEGVSVLLHPAGEERTAFDALGIRVVPLSIYAAEPAAPGAGFEAALARGAVALLHSARAARRFRELAGNRHRIVAISPTVLAAAGQGWTAATAAGCPTDDALLAAAARLCHGDDRDEHQL